ncbi:MAG: hypothetical protein PHW82_11850 [Bacteroidales bacterium]|nr:hypothetical protein [Bacteroidales bacterium]
MKNNQKIIFIVFTLAIILSCNTSIKRKTSILHTLEEQNIKFLVYNQNSFNIYIPINDAIRFCDSINTKTTDFSYEFFYYYSLFFSQIDQEFFIVNDSDVQRDIYNFICDKNLETRISREEFEHLNEYCFSRIIQANLKIGNVKIFDKSINKFVTKYRLVVEKGTFIGEVEYYYLLNGALLWEYRISLGL